MTPPSLTKRGTESARAAESKEESYSIDEGYDSEERGRKQDADEETEVSVARFCVLPPQNLPLRSLHVTVASKKRKRGEVVEDEYKHLKSSEYIDIRVSSLIN